MGDTDQNNQLQQNQNQGTLNHNVAGIAPSNSQGTPLDNRTHNNSVIWTVWEKMRLVEIDTEERAKGYGFMNRVKNRWDEEFPEKMQYSKQNLRDNASRLRDDRELSILVSNDRTLTRNVGPNEPRQEGPKTAWSNEMKARLVQMEQQERNKGRGFMSRLKTRWDDEFPQMRHISAQSLRDNANRFKKETALMNLLVVRGREEPEEHDEEIVQGALEEEESAVVVQIEDNIDNEQVDRSLIERGRDENIAVGDRQSEQSEMRDTFFQQLDTLKKSTLTEFQEREMLRKLKVNEKMKEEANVILEDHLKSVDSIAEITDAVCAMAKTIEQLMGMNEGTVQRVRGENRRVRKLNGKMKILRQYIARAANEIHRRKIWRKATNKEKKILENLKRRANSDLSSLRELLAAKEKWLDELRSKKVKLEKIVAKDKRIKNNNMFVRNEGTFYRQTKKLEKQVGRVPSINKFTYFWAGIWEDDSKTPVTKWMKGIEKRLREKVKSTSEFKVTEKDLQDVAKKKKNWSAPGIDGITSYWWKTLTATRKPLARAMKKWVDDNTTIPQ